MNAWKIMGKPEQNPENYLKKPLRTDKKSYFDQPSLTGFS